MKKLLLAPVLILVVLFLFSCATEPETTEEETTQKTAAEEKQPEKEDETYGTTKEQPQMDRELLDSAQSALDRAESVGAKRYAADLYRQAADELKEARSLADSEPEKAEALARSAQEKAQQAYDKSVDAAYSAYTRRLNGLAQKLRDIEAEKYEPEKIEEFRRRYEELKTTYNAGKMPEAKKLADSLVTDMSNFHDKLSEQIRWVKILKRDTELYFEDAERKESFKWAPEKLDQANMAYFDGIEAFEDNDLDRAEELFGTSKKLALDAIRLADERRAKSRSRAAMLEVKKAIERASGYGLQTEEGEVLEAQPWSGDEYLTEEDLQDGDTEVQGEISSRNLLDEAKRTWQMGVEERRKGNHQKALEYFEEARSYVEAYEKNAVWKVYTVKKRASQHDCLWRISQEVYGDPLLWPKIWRRNREKIQDPDVILPGWKLIIPPK